MLLAELKEKRFPTPNNTSEMQISTMLDTNSWDQEERILVVGILVMELRMSEANSLKGKRRVLKSLLDKVKARYNVSVAEVGKQDTWHFSTIGVSFVSNDSAHVHQTLTAVVRFVEDLGTVELLDVRMELL